MPLSQPCSPGWYEFCTFAPHPITPYMSLQTLRAVLKPGIDIATALLAPLDRAGVARNAGRAGVARNAGRSHSTLNKSALVSGTFSQSGT